MNNLDASTESVRQSSRAGNRLTETPPDRRGQPPGEDRGAAIREKALDILRREIPSLTSDLRPPTSAVPPAPPTSPTSPDTSDRRPQFPEAIPARMLNEFVYCPRLFFYEFVEGVFVENADTVRGKSLHRRVDTDGGALPPASSGKSKTKRMKAEDAGQQNLFGGQPPAPPVAGSSRREEAQTPESATLLQSGESAPPTPNTQPSTDEVIHSRSVQMGSQRLGVTAKMDLVEVRAPRGSRREEAQTENSATPIPQSEADQSLVTSAATGGQGDLFNTLEVCPVDYKAGAPKAGEESNELWDADKMQLGLQTLILRENGYACREGIIYYRATKQRVRLPITPELEAWIVEQVGAARQAAVGAIPPPLCNSAKCPRCSLVTVCLPDETRMLADSFPHPTCGHPLPSDGRGAGGEGDSHPSTRNSPPAAPRRLIAARDDTRALYLNKPGLRVGRKDELLQIKEERSVLDEVRLNDVSHVALFGNIQISTQAIQSLCEAEIPVSYFSMGGWFYGITRGHELKNVFLRIEQFRQARDPAVCLRLARQFVHGKIRNHRTMLMRNHLEAPPATLLKLKQMADAALRAEAMDQLLGIEGNGASAYFEQFSGMIKIADDLPGDIPFSASDEEKVSGGRMRNVASGGEGTQRLFNFNFTHRNRRPPTDPVNAMLSLAYSLLAKDCVLALLAVGFDPYVGFFHQPRFGRPALALDLMEEFRALVGDSTVLSCINNRAVNENDFVRAGQAVNLTSSGRRRFFEMYELRMNSVLTHPVFDYKVSYRRALELQARMLAKVLTGEIPEYVPLTTR